MLQTIFAVLAAVLLSTTANADTTYTYTGNIIDLACTGTCSPFTPYHSGSFSGTITFAGDTSQTNATYNFGWGNPIITSLDISYSGFTLQPVAMAYPSNLYGFGWGSYTAAITFTDGEITAWTLHVSSGGGPESANATVASTGDLVGFTDCGTPFVCSGYSGQASSGSWSAPIVTPLPGALPLFATGLGALSLLGWRRKEPTGLSAPN
jgi:hypothetical protein